jgi:hypothetical protein
MPVTSPAYHVGDTYPFVVALKKADFSIFQLSAVTDTVTVRWRDENTDITPPVTVTSTTPGADWTNGKVAVQFDATNAGLVAPYAGRNLTLEIQIDRTGAGKKTFSGPYLIKAATLP